MPVDNASEVREDTDEFYNVDRFSAGSRLDDMKCLSSDLIYLPI